MYVPNFLDGFDRLVAFDPETTGMIRLRAGISYALTEATDEGHCGLPTDQLIPLAEELLERPKELILTALELERSDGAMIADKVGDTACTFLVGLYRAEQVIADRLIRIVNGRLSWTWIDEEKALPWVEKRSGLQLADNQRGAIRLALTLGRNNARETCSLLPSPRV